MSHIPVNHPCGRSTGCSPRCPALYVLVFGVVGVVQTAGSPFFDRSDVTALGLRTNLAFALLSIVAGR